MQGEINCLHDDSRDGDDEQILRSMAIYPTLMPCHLCTGAIVQLGHFTWTLPSSTLHTCPVKAGQSKAKPDQRPWAHFLVKGLFPEPVLP